MTDITLVRLCAHLESKGITGEDLFRMFQVIHAHLEQASDLHFFHSCMQVLPPELREETIQDGTDSFGCGASNKAAITPSYPTLTVRVTSLPRVYSRDFFIAIGPATTIDALKTAIVNEMRELGHRMRRRDFKLHLKLWPPAEAGPLVVLRLVHATHDSRFSDLPEHYEEGPRYHFVCQWADTW